MPDHRVPSPLGGEGQGEGATNSPRKARTKSVQVERENDDLRLTLSDGAVRVVIGCFMGVSTRALPWMRSSFLVVSVCAYSNRSLLRKLKVKYNYLYISMS
jgi:hypothetical protein